MNRQHLGLTLIISSLLTLTAVADESYDYPYDYSDDTTVEYGVSVDSGEDEDDNMLSSAVYVQDNDVQEPFFVSGSGHRCPNNNFTRTLRGEASFYGGPTNRMFEGRRTACGNVFRSVELTAALPQRMLTLNGTGNSVRCGSWARVTNQSNGRTVWVRLTDTGGFARLGRVIDLSHGAATQLGFVSRGHTNVNVEICPHSRDQIARANDI